MKKFLLIGLIVALALIVIGGAGVVFAKVRGNPDGTAVTQNTVQQGDEIQQFGYGPGGMMGQNEYGYGPGGMMGQNEYGYGPGGMMGGDEYGYGSGGMMGRYGRGGMMGGRSVGAYAGIMHDYMISAFASAVGLSVDEVNTQLANGQSFAQIAISQGKTKADLPALWSQVRQEALNKAVADGVITQAQADAMVNHMKNYSDSRFGDCPMWDGDEAQP